MKLKNAYSLTVLLDFDERPETDNAKLESALQQAACAFANALGDVVASDYWLADEES